MIYKIACLNIGNPSLERAKVQVEWLLEQKKDILVLTEYKKGNGGLLIQKKLLEEGYKVFENLKTSKEYGVLIAIKNIKANELKINISNLPERVIYIKSDKISLMGIYVPANDKNKEIRKRPFIEELLLNIKKFKPSIICGDFNTISRTHIPKYKTFKEWEYLFMDQILELGYKEKSKDNDYSWIGRTGNTYKYDYIFINKEIKIIDSISYNEETIKLKLTDHSIVEAKFKVLGE